MRRQAGLEQKIAASRQSVCYKAAGAGGDGGYTMAQVMKEFGLTRYYYVALVASGLIVPCKGVVPADSVQSLRQLLSGKKVVSPSHISQQLPAPYSTVQKNLQALIEAGLVEMVGGSGKGRHFYVCNLADEKSVVSALTARHAESVPLHMQLMAGGVKQYRPDKVYTPDFFCVGDTVEHRYGRTNSHLAARSYGRGQVVAVEPNMAREDKSGSQAIVVQFDGRAVMKLSVQTRNL